MPATTDFADLTPERILFAVETATDCRLTGLVSPLPSYINRVYELQDVAGCRKIVKFYRPGRWSKNALLDEHRFIADCNTAEIPVVAPQTLADGTTLAEHDGIYFAVFPKRAGREMEITSDDDWLRLGRLIGRLHTVAAAAPAKSRLRLHPNATLMDDCDRLLRGFLPGRFRNLFQELTEELREIACPLFSDHPEIRLHGDLHKKNLLHRPGEGILVIDFDDMMTGPAMQDLWLLLPDRADRCRRELHLLLEGYETFRPIPPAAQRLIEPLRCMRQIYFLAWCSRQVGDVRFSQTFPDWGSDAFWSQEIRDLQDQMQSIRNTGSPGFHFIADL